MSAPLTRASDRACPMPCGNPERLDAIGAALTTLEGEQRRLERLGFELPLARCHQERRYWEFLHAIHQVAVGEPEAGAAA